MITREEIKNTPEIVDFMLDKSVIADSRMKLHKRLEEICELAIKTLDCQNCGDKVGTPNNRSLTYRTCQVRLRRACRA